MSYEENDLSGLDAMMDMMQHPSREALEGLVRAHEGTINRQANRIAALNGELAALKAGQGEEGASPENTGESLIVGMPGFFPPASADYDRLEQERAEQWRLCRDAQADRDTANAVAAELRVLVEAMRADTDRFQKLLLWMSSNVPEGWSEVERIGAVCAYVSIDEARAYIDNLPDCNVGLCGK